MKEDIKIKINNNVPLIIGKSYEIRGQFWEYIGDFNSLKEVPNQRCCYMINNNFYIREYIKPPKKLNEEPIVNRRGKDLLVLFIFTSIITVLMMITQFMMFRLIIPNAIQLPIEQFVNALMCFILIYGGFEGTTSFVKSSNLPQGQSARLPEYKLKRLLGYIITIMILTIVAMVLQSITSNDGPSFAIEAFGLTTATSLSVYVAARTGTKIGENINLKNNNTNNK